MTTRAKDPEGTGTTNGSEQTSTRSASADSTIVDRIANFLERFILLQRPELYRLIALWIVSTHLMKVWEYTGYLFFHSPEPQSGKSRALEVLDVFVANSSSILISPTEAVLFRTADGQTQLLDEVDSWRNRDQLRSVLNAGFRKGGTVSRMDQTDKGYRLKKFSVFGARALAGIGASILDATTKDRTFSIEMRRQTKDERREPFRMRKIGQECELLRKEITQWAKNNSHCVEELYARDFEYLDDFKDRTIDIAQSLAAVVETVYRGRDDIVDARLALVHGIAITRREEDTVIKDHDLLRKLCELSETKDPLVGTATELAALCGDSVDTNDVSATLRRYGFTTRSIRKDGTPKYRYELSHDRLVDLVARYMGSTEDQAE